MKVPSLVEIYNILKKNVYDKYDGRCIFCKAETIWGDSPHKLDCLYVELQQYIEEMTNDNIID